MRDDTPLRAIKKKCMQCTLGQRSVLADCGVQACGLYNYRFGKLPETAARRGKKMRAVTVEMS